MFSFEFFKRVYHSALSVHHADRLGGHDLDPLPLDPPPYFLVPKPSENLPKSKVFWYGVQLFRKGVHRPKPYLAYFWLVGPHPKKVGPLT